MGKPGTSQPQLKTTIFSWILATPVDEQEAIEAPPHPASPLAEDEVLWCTSPPPGIEQSKRYMLVVTSLVDRMNLGPVCDNARGSSCGKNAFQNPWMLAVFPPPCGAAHYGSANLTELDG